MYGTHPAPYLEQFLVKLNSVAQPADVLRLSDLYLQRKIQLSTIWSDARLKNAYLSYFLPLNLLRLSSVIKEAQELHFFDSLTSVIDFGSGPGTFDIGAHFAQLNFKELHFIESSSKAIEAHKEILQKCKIPSLSKKWTSSPSHQANAGTLGVFSYSLNELDHLPDWALACEALMIIEPSTQNEGRKLQQLRAPLIKAGFSIWAPCTHQSGCPLLLHSKTDWCHQRIHVDLPARVAQLEKDLPMKNKTLTYSYLLAKKSSPPRAGEVRVIGDTLYERGKVKQAVCRNENREFFSWLTRNGEPSPIPRGTRMQLPEGTELKGNEIRITN